MTTTEHQPLDLAIVGGCGHVGLPLALAFTAAGRRVGIFDVDEVKMDQVRQGQMPFLEANAPALLAQALADARLALSSSPSILTRCPVVVLVIGTPIDEFLNPSLRVFDRVIDDIAPWLAPGTLVVLRSTVFPGTTDFVEQALADRGCRVDVAFCPERIAEGRAIEEITTLPQIVGASSERAGDRAEALFRLLVPTIVRTTPKEAELAKLFNNAWRYLKFAVANQFFMMAEQAGVDYGAVLHAVRHEYPRGADLPGPGFAAGPCLLKDTMQLRSFTGDNFVLGHAAMLVNEGMPEFLVKRLEREGGVRGRTVAILGMAFKAESDDTRASLSYKLRKLLWFAGAKVLCTDPYVAGPDIVELDKALAEADIVIVAAPHQAYRALDFGERKVVDIWGTTPAGIRLA